MQTIARSNRICSHRINGVKKHIGKKENRRYLANQFKGAKNHFKIVIVRRCIGLVHGEVHRRPAGLGVVPLPWSENRVAASAATP